MLVYPHSCLFPSDVGRIRDVTFLKTAQPLEENAWSEIKVIVIAVISVVAITAHAFSNLDSRFLEMGIRLQGKAQAYQLKHKDWAWDNRDAFHNFSLPAWGLSYCHLCPWWEAAASALRPRFEWSDLPALSEASLKCLSLTARGLQELSERVCTNLSPLLTPCPCVQSSLLVFYLRCPIWNPHEGNVSHRHPIPAPVLGLTSVKHRSHPRNWPYGLQLV